MKSLKVYTLAWACLLCGLHSYCRQQPERSKLRLEVVTPDAALFAGSDVYVTGDFNDWSPNQATHKLKRISGNLFGIELSFPEGQKIEYKYTLGSMNTVERNIDESDKKSRQFTVSGGETVRDTVPLWSFPVKEHYAKQEYQIQMRDGVKLFTSVYRPRDTSRAYPVLLQRTPYGVGPYGPDNYRRGLEPSSLLAQEGYIFVYQDVRGKLMSEGEFEGVRPHKVTKKSPADIDESTDTYDTIDWLVKNVPGNNGRVGLYGISYPGFYAAASLIDAHPALKAVSPQGPVTDLFMGDDVHHNGAFLLMNTFDFISVFSRPRPVPTTSYPPAFNYGNPDGYKFYLNLGKLKDVNSKYFNNEIADWETLMKHGNYDAFWKARTLLPHLKNVRPAVMAVGGWFDAEDLYGTLKTYQAIEKQNPATNNTLVMGPWCHGCWAAGKGASLDNVDFGSNTSVFFRTHIELPFFNHHLKDKGTSRLPEAFVFHTGSNQWKKYDKWPPAASEEKQLYLHKAGKLSLDAPAQAAEADQYTSDPANPVPYSAKVGTGWPRQEYMIEDQRFLRGRTDLLNYATEPLTEDITLVGPVAANLYVSTTGTDADFIVKLIDVYPDETAGNAPGAKGGGKEMLVRAEVMRAKFRNSLEKPDPLVPNQVTNIKLDLQDVAHTFKKGHRLMVQVQSSWFPLVDRNPQQFMDIYQAGPGDFKPAVHSIHYSPRSPSHLVVRTIK